MLVYPQINPVALSVGPIAIHWYGILYLVSFIVVWLLAQHRVKKLTLDFTSDQISDLLFYGALGVILGGRIGYVLFYNFHGFLAHPMSIFKVWQGGMSFHGGLIGVSVALWFYARKIEKPYIAVMDFIAPLVPIGLGLGRVGNFINGELWGRVTNVPWAIVYPQAGWQPRHPSEIYEFLLEGVFLFFVLWCYSSRPRPAMSTSALFLFGYGCVRFFCEFFRQPDPQFGFIAFKWLTMGQLLSIPMVVIGLGLFIWSHKKST